MTNIENHLYNFLAILNRDGGQYLSEYGLDKAVENAKKNYYDRIKELDTASYENRNLIAEVRALREAEKNYRFSVRDLAAECQRVKADREKAEAELAALRPEKEEVRAALQTALDQDGARIVKGRGPRRSDAGPRQDAGRASAQCAVLRDLQGARGRDRRRPQPADRQRREAGQARAPQPRSLP